VIDLRRFFEISCGKTNRRTDKLINAAKHPANRLPNVTNKSLLSLTDPRDAKAQRMLNIP